MPDFRTRSHAPEIMDDLACSGEVVHQTLRELDFINAWLGGNAVTLNGIAKLINRIPKKPGSLRIADMGCGSGDLLRIIHQHFRKDIPQLTLTGIDANPNITAYAARHLAEYTNISIQTENVFQPSSSTFDIITATLFLHHFTEAELVGLLREWKKRSRFGIVINDLHRHPLAYHSIGLLTRMFSRSAMVKYDAPLSVLRGFSKSEWKHILKEAEIEDYTLQWKWAFRWQLIIPASGK